MINNGHIGLHYLRNLKRKANEATNNPCGPATGIGGSVCVNRLRPVEAVGGGMSDFWKDYEPEPSKTAPVQKPVAYEYGDDVFWHDSPDINDYIRANGKALVYATPPAAAVLESRDWSLLEATQESLREHIAEIKRLKEAQPAVPDAIHHTDLSEHPQYIEGWNDCRAEMLKGMKP